MSEAQKPEGGSIKHDVSVPVGSIPELLDRAANEMIAYMPGARPVMFGHMGDGNIHLTVSQPIGMDKNAFQAEMEKINDIVHSIVLDLGGSISAEHGVGLLKRDFLGFTREEADLALMAQLKTVFDPNQVMNPGKLLPAGKLPRA